SPSQSWYVASRFVRRTSARSAHEVPTTDAPARWNTRSGRVARRTPAAAPGSVRSQGTVATSFWRAARLSADAPGSTGPAPSAPSRSANSARWLPAKPAIPVIRTFTARAALYALAPVLEEVLEGHLERDRGFPAGDAPELRVVSDEERHVGGPHPGGILL